MMSQGHKYGQPEREDFYDILRRLSPLPEGTKPHESCTRDNPIIVHEKTGEFYTLSHGAWRLADK